MKQSKFPSKKFIIAYTTIGMIFVGGALMLTNNQVDASNDTSPKSELVNQTDIENSKQDAEKVTKAQTERDTKIKLEAEKAKVEKAKAEEIKKKEEIRKQAEIEANAKVEQEMQQAKEIKEANEKQVIINAANAKAAEDEAQKMKEQEQINVSSYQNSVQPANTLNINGSNINYVAGGIEACQSIIDSNPNGIVATFGGAVNFSGTDGQNTHFAGHNPGVFAPVMGLELGNIITVTDSASTPFNYQVDRIILVNPQGYDVNTGAYEMDNIIGTDGGERITLQCCGLIDGSVIRIVYAHQV